MNDLGLFWPLLGGTLIGLSAAGYLLLLGRVAGVTGILAAALGLQPGGNRRLALGFLAGLLLGSALAMTWLRQPQILIEASTPLLVIGGLLVGFGTRWGSGCTSGHGVCGLARFSPRSLAATLTFMGVAGLVVFATRHLFGNPA